MTSTNRKRHVFPPVFMASLKDGLVLLRLSVNWTNNSPYNCHVFFIRTKHLTGSINFVPLDLKHIKLWAVAMPPRRPLFCPRNLHTKFVISSAHCAMNNRQTPRRAVGPLTYHSMNPKHLTGGVSCTTVDALADTPRGQLYFSSPLCCSSC